MYSSTATLGVLTLLDHGAIIYTVMSLASRMCSAEIRLADSFRDGDTLEIYARPTYMHHRRPQVHEVNQEFSTDGSLS